MTIAMRIVRNRSEPGPTPSEGYPQTALALLMPPGRQQERISA
jgi:hypothetical protein